MKITVTVKMNRKGEIERVELQTPGDELKREQRRAALRRIVEAVKSELADED